MKRGNKTRFGEKQKSVERSDRNYEKYKCGFYKTMEGYLQEQNDFNTVSDVSGAGGHHGAVH